MKLGELLPMINGTDICIVDDNDFYYYENYRTKFIASVFNDKKLTENEVINMNVKMITTGANGIIIVVE